MKEMATQRWRGVTRQVFVQRLLSMVVVVLVAIAATGGSAAAPELSCDYNGDGVCDAADYVVWRNLLNTPGPLPNDSTPGSIDQSDYVHWKAGFGDIGGSAAVSTTNGVPEPASSVLVASAILMLVLRRRR